MVGFSFNITAKEKNKSVKQIKLELKQSYDSSYSRLYKALKAKDMTHGLCVVTGKDFDKFAKSKHCESVLKVRREWFIRMSKGLKIMSQYLAGMRSAKRYNDEKEYKKAEALFEKTRARLISVMKLRKKEYLVKS